MNAPGLFTTPEDLEALADAISKKLGFFKIKKLLKTPVTIAPAGVPAETIVFQTTFAAGEVQAGDIIRVEMSSQKVSTVGPNAQKLRLGVSGDLTDAIIWSATPGAGSKSFGYAMEFMATQAGALLGFTQRGNASATTPMTGANSGVGNSAAATINIASAFTVSITGLNGNAADDLTFRDIVIYHMRPAVGQHV